MEYLCDLCQKNYGNEYVIIPKNGTVSWYYINNICDRCLEKIKLNTEHLIIFRVDNDENKDIE